MSQDLLSFLDEPGPGGDKGSNQTSPPVRQHLETSHIDIVDNKNVDWPQAGQASDEPPATSQTLFEGTNDGDDEDFGDFQDASPAPVPAPASAPIAAPVKPRSQPEPPKPKPPAKETRPPFPPKAPRSTPPQPSPQPKKDTVIGAHPFAGRMDFLFEDDNDDYDAGADELGDLANNPEAAMAYSKRILAEQAEAEKGKGKGKQPAGQRGGFVDLGEEREGGMSGVGSGGGAKARDRKQKDPNVLFDADDVSDDGANHDDNDDFGDFETWNEPAKSAAAPKQSRPEPPSAGMDLLGLDDEPPTQPGPDAVRSRSAAQRQYSDGSRQRQTSAAPNLQQNSADDSFWDDFDTPAPAAKAQYHPRRQPQQEDSWPDFETLAPSPPNPSHPKPKQQHPHQTQPDLLPPKNVPPPIIILSLFPSIFSSADAALFSTTAKLPLPSRTALLSHPATHQFLRGYLAQMSVLARIIAGQKLRWKRDQRLSQGVRIGPAAAGGKGGMKLAGLDKSEVAKEDREVVETIRLYRAQIGKLRTAVTGASSAPGLPKLPPVPDIAETMPSKALKQSEGGIMAREACALCGLRREERVVKVDDGVEDSFGEWWVQGTSMHKGCKDFWEEHEGKLKSR